MDIIFNLIAHNKRLVVIENRCPVSFVTKNISEPRFDLLGFEATARV